MSKPVAITASLLGVGAIAFTTAIALPFDDRVEFRANNRIDSKPAWLVPQKAEFLGIQRGWGGLKIVAAIAGTTAMGGAMVVSRSQAAREPVRQRIRGYQNQAEEFSAAAESAYEMALTQQRYKTLLEADQVAFEGQIETVYLESMGIDPTSAQPALPGTSLDQTTNPGDKVREAEVKPAIADAQADAIASELSRLPNMTNYPSVLIYGAQGSGKSSFAGNEIKNRLAAGHQAIVLDPHAAYGAWSGCEVIGGGMDYEAIDSRLKWFSDEVGKRYKVIQTQPNPRFKPLTLVCDEFTNWASRCDSSGEFFKTALSDIRKAECYVLIVSHTRTLPGLGDAKGMAALRDAALLEIELLGELDPVTGKAVPKFEAWVKLPGQSLSDRTLVKIPRQEPQQQAIIDTDYLERLYNLEFNLNPPTVSPAESVADNTVSAKNSGSASDSSEPDTVDTYPDTDWLPTQKQLLGMLKDTNLPAGRFIKETLKATKPERYRTAKQAITWVVRHLGDFKLIEKFKDLL